MNSLKRIHSVHEHRLVLRPQPIEEKPMRGVDSVDFYANFLLLRKTLSFEKYNSVHYIMRNHIWKMKRQKYYTNHNAHVAQWIVEFLSDSCPFLMYIMVYSVRILHHKFTHLFDMRQSTSDNWALQKGMEPTKMEKVSAFKNPDYVEKKLKQPLGFSPKSDRLSGDLVYSVYKF